MPCKKKLIIPVPSRRLPSRPKSILSQTQVPHGAVVMLTMLAGRRVEHALNEKLNRKSMRYMNELETFGATMQQSGNDYGSDTIFGMPKKEREKRTLQRFSISILMGLGSSLIRCGQLHTELGEKYFNLQVKRGFFWWFFISFSSWRVLRHMFEMILTSADSCSRAGAQAIARFH